MAIPRTITSANAIFLLSVGLIYPVAQQIEGFATDSAWAFDPVTNKEVLQGVDGKISAGWTPHLTPMSITVMPNHNGYDIFDTWANAEEIAQESMVASGSIMLPAIGRKFVISDGYLQAFTQIPDAKKVLQAMTYKIIWGSILPSPI